MSVTELLAPCGTMDALTAAVRCGADAVYLGTNTLNARKNAENFTWDSLGEAVRYCHARGVKVHLALNTLVRDTELSEAAAAIRQAAKLGVDALIIQDLGVFTMARALVPSMELHASTQLTIHTPSGVKLAGELGFHRVVLAREMSREELSACRAQTALPLEVFVHGALCMCVSGQCYLSAMLGSRSGNRGLCAQPCRLPFSVKEPGAHDLSLKDLSLVDSVRDMAALGIDSLKIEGRMKRPEYVAAAVTACREALSGTVRPILKEQLRRVFSRSGFTDGYYTGQRDASMFGYRKKEDVEGAAEVLKELAETYRQEPPRIPCRFHLKLHKGYPVSLTVSAGTHTVTVTDAFLPPEAVSRPTTREMVCGQLEKCGGTPFYPEKITVELDEGLMLPKSALNALRRGALEKLLAKLEETPSHPVFPLPDTLLNLIKQGHNKNSAPVFTARFSSSAQIPQELSGISTVYVPLETPENELKLLTQRGIELGVELPRGMFGQEEAVRSLLAKAKRAGISIALCGNLGAIALAQEAGMEPRGDFGLNCMNSAALAALQSLGVRQTVLSMELTAKQAAALRGSLSRGVLIYGHVPLMLLRNCPVRAHSSCGACGGKGSVTDRKGIRFPVTCRMGVSELLNSRPIYLGDKLGDFESLDFLEFYFTSESAEECAAIMDAYRRGLPPHGEFTRGLLYRGVE